ncbi:hypothetical protein FZC84_09225 [Rossellomorea vietnamensis]|uniref:Uncharacterized protein n=1 Tax=Rossellomorea vietnamensis TaxID=218284 RepID=A0A5D4MEG3_9BACI|nr:hypothetical protein FZC84_09225 [Rossellomorea vietnamensis]
MTSCGTSVTGETPQVKPRRLTARPAESRTWSGNQFTLISLTTLMQIIIVFLLQINQPFRLLIRCLYFKIEPIIPPDSFFIL